MNKKFLVTLFLAATFGSIYAEVCNPCKLICPPDPCRCKATSQTFFTVRPEFQAGMPERTTLWRDRMLARIDGRGGALQVVPFGGRSTRSSDLAGYFSIDCKPVLSVCEDADGPASDRDILANHLNIYTKEGTSDNNINEPIKGFKSTICFEPERTVGGVGLTYRHGFARRDDGRGFWFEMSFPIETVKTTMNLGETVESDGGGALEFTTVAGYTVPVESAVALDGTPTSPVGNVQDAFRQAAWAYGRIDADDCSGNKKTGVADIDLLIGYDIVQHERCYLSSHAGILAPTGNRPSGVLLFEPIVGHNKHMTLRYGNHFGIETWRHATRDESIWFAFHSEFFFHLNNRQTRSFDLKNKEWSRYMQAYDSVEQANQAFDTDNKFLHTPGINVFTQDVCVDAGTARTYQSAFFYNRGSFQGEIGYTFFCRPAECVKLECAFPECVALKSLERAGCVNNVQTIGDNYGDVNAQGASCGLRADLNADAPIKQFSPAIYKENVIKESDLDLNSAAHPGMVTYIVYGSLGNRWDDREYPFFFGGGGSYEFSSENTGMSRWLVWAKGGFSF